MCVDCEKSDEQTCYHTLDSLDVWGKQVQSWMQNGCYKIEVYGEVEHINPCPVHVICAQLEDSERISYCKDPPQEKSKDAT